MDEHTILMNQPFHERDINTLYLDVSDRNQEARATCRKLEEEFNYSEAERTMVVIERVRSAVQVVRELSEKMILSLQVIPDGTLGEALGPIDKNSRSFITSEMITVAIRSRIRSAGKRVDGTTLGRYQNTNPRLLNSLFMELVEDESFQLIE